ncbi:MAG: hypothetical protein V5A46_06580 [Haloferacaceae archaeon]
MRSSKGRPGPVAESAFRTGLVSATVAGLSVVAGLYWIGWLTRPMLSVLALLAPVYLVFAAALLNVWLGYGGESVPLRRVTVPADSGGSDLGGSDPAPRDPADGDPNLAIRLANDPVAHLTLIGAALSVGIAARLFGFHVEGLYALLTAFLVSVFTTLRFLWPRLETFFTSRETAREESGRGRSADEAGDRTGRAPPGSGRPWDGSLGGWLSPESKTGMTVTVVVCALLVGVVLLASYVS